MITIAPMGPEHIDEVYAIELSSFAIPWTKAEFYKELYENRYAVYLVALDSSETPEVLGYAGMWHVVNEGHITNVAVREDARRRGVGGSLIKALIGEGISRGMIGLTLEVRVGNTRAQCLYTKYGFVPEGLRRNYYSDTREDAVIMWKYLGRE